jgi:hypothetical protein
MKKLNTGQKHILNLIAKGADSEGWAVVSSLVFNLVEQMPKELVLLERVSEEGRGRVRLTTEGESLMSAMAWL